MADHGTDLIKYVNKTTGKWESLDPISGEIVSEEKYFTPEMKIPYSVALARNICMAIRDGKSIKDICTGRDGAPSYSTFCLWKYRYPDFREAVKDAQADSAQILAEKVLDIAAGSSTDKLQQDDKKIEMEALKWMAEKQDPNKFGKQTKVTGDSEQPITIMVNTGIKRD